MTQTQKLSQRELAHLITAMYHAQNGSATDEMFYEMACLQVDFVNLSNGHQVDWLA